MKKSNMIPNLSGALAVATLAATLVASPASAQTATSTTPTAAKKKPTSATPQMIDEAVQRSKARTAKAAATGKPEQFGSEEPYTYTPTY